MAFCELGCFRRYVKTNKYGVSSTMNGSWLVFFLAISVAQALRESETITESEIYNNSVVVPDESDDHSTDKERRLTSPSLKLGEQRLLALRVSSTFGGGESPLTWANEIEGAIFGNGQKGSPLNPVASLVSQYKAVSHGQLVLIPAAGDGILNGVAEVEVNVKIAGRAVDGELPKIIFDRAAAALGKPLEEVADFIIVCLPDGATVNGSADWSAFAKHLEPVSTVVVQDTSIGTSCVSDQSLFNTHLLQKTCTNTLHIFDALDLSLFCPLQYNYFQRSRCTKLSYMMHELGHSLGFRHSGMGDDEYGTSKLPSICVLHFFPKDYIHALSNCPIFKIRLSWSPIGDESGYMGYAKNEFGLPRRAFVSARPTFQ